MSDRTEIEVAETGLIPETEAEAPVAEQGDRPRTQREIMMERIVAKVERQRQEEMGQQPQQPEAEAGTEPAPRPVNRELGEVEEDRDYRSPYEPEAPAATVQEPQPQPRPAPQAREAAAPELITVTLDGQNVQVTQDQLVQLARMGMIANQTISQYQQGQFAAPQQQPQQQAEVRRVEPDHAPTVDRDLARQTVKRIQYGTEDDAAEALEQFANRVVQNAPRAPQVDAQAIVNQSVTEARRQARMEQIQAQLRQDYPEVFANDQLQHLAGLNIMRVAQEAQMLGRPMSDVDIYREAGARVYDLIGKPRPGAQADPQSAPQQQPQQAPAVRRAPGLDARKREIPRATAQVIDRRAPAPEAPRVPTGSDAVDKMRRDRGQPSMR